MYRLFFQKSIQPKLNIEKWVILSSSLPPTGLSPPCQMPYVSPMQMRRKAHSAGCTKKECTGLDREQPFSSPFYCPFSCCPSCAHIGKRILFSLSAPHRQQNPDTTRHWELDTEPWNQNDSASPFPLTTAVGSTLTASRQERREPTGAVGRPASVRRNYSPYVWTDPRRQ